MATSKIPQQLDTSVQNPTFENGVKYNKTNGIVYVNFVGENNVDIPKNRWTNIYTLPSKYRPNVDFTTNVALGSMGTFLGICTVKNTGAVIVYQNVTETVKGVWGFISFPAATWG